MTIGSRGVVGWETGVSDEGSKCKGARRTRQGPTFEGITLFPTVQNYVEKRNFDASRHLISKTRR